MTEVTPAAAPEGGAIPPVGLRRYSALLGRPEVRHPVLWGLLARLPFGMNSLALLLLVQDRTGSYATAGLVTACFAAALALAAPFRGRSADRRGAAQVVRLSGIVHAVALGLALAAILSNRPLGVVLPLVALAGAAFPPVGPVVRSLWQVLCRDDRELSTAYALDSVLVEVSFVSGPLLVGAAAAAGMPEVAVAFGAVATLVGALGLARTEAVRGLTGKPAVGRRDLLGPLRSGPVRWLLLAVLFMGVGFGSIEVGAPAYATERDSAVVGGVLLSVWALGSVLGGLGYGARDWRHPPATQYPVLVALLAVGLVLPTAAAGPGLTGLLVLGAVLLVGGMTIAPFSTCNSVLLGRVAPAGMVTEAFGWSGTGIVVGIAVGNALTGVVVEELGVRAGFGVAAIAGGLSLLVALAGGASRRAGAAVVATG